MEKMSHSEYTDMKMGFMEKHHMDFRVETSQLDVQGCYHKEYFMADGSIWFEVMSPVEEQIHTKGVSDLTGREVVDRVTLQWMRTEFWSTDDSHSRYTYEAW